MNDSEREQKLRELYIGRELTYSEIADIDRASVGNIVRRDGRYETPALELLGGESE